MKVLIILSILIIGTFLILLYLSIRGLKSLYPLISKKDKIKLGVGIFPDTMPFFLAKERDFRYFTGEHIDLEIKPIKKWENIYEELDASKEDGVDIIIGNRDIYRDKNTEGQYYYLNDIHCYRGFSILVQTPEGQKIDKFSEKFGKSNNVIEALKKTLNQISRNSKFLIYASDSDHHKSLTKLISFVGLKPEHFNIININTERAFKKFARKRFMRWEGEKLHGKAFVGGITHRLCADRGSNYNGIYEIFSLYEDIIERGLELKNEKGFMLDLTQYNGFVINTKGYKNKGFMKIIKRIYRCWNKIIREIERDRDHYVPHLIALLKARFPYYRNKLPELSGKRKLIKKIWKEWEKYKIIT